MDNQDAIKKKLVLGAVQVMKTHPTADELFKYLETRSPKTSRTAVLRYLKQLSDSGEIRMVAVPGADDRFDLVTSQHYHILGPICGRFTNIPIPYMTDLDEIIGEMTDYDMESHDIVFKGICPGCKIKN